MKRKSILMIVTLVTMMLLTINIIAQEPARPAAAPAARPAFRMPPRIVSPEINSDNSVTLRVYSKDTR